MNYVELLEQYAAGRRDFQEIILPEANLEQTDLREINLIGADLKEANLRKTNLS